MSGMLSWFTVVRASAFLLSRRTWLFLDVSSSWQQYGDLSHVDTNLDKTRLLHTHLIPHQPLFFILLALHLSQSIHLGHYLCKWCCVSFSISEYLSFHLALIYSVLYFLLFKSMSIVSHRCKISTKKKIRKSNWQL